MGYGQRRAALGGKREKGAWAAGRRRPGRGQEMTDSADRTTLDDLIVSDPEVLGGRRVFRNTRVPVEALFENLADGLSLDEILEEFETLNRDDVVRVLELTSARLARPRAA